MTKVNFFHDWCHIYVVNSAGNCGVKSESPEIVGNTILMIV